ncbi:MAG: hypothetical protein RIA65_11245, partial [Woeseia sp.]
MSRNLGRLILVVVIAAVIGAYFVFDLQQYLSLTELKQQRDALAEYAASRPLLSIGGFFLVYVVVAALSLPGAAILTIAGGAVFGLGTGTLVVSFASSIGATLAFFAARFLLQDTVR